MFFCCFRSWVLKWNGKKFDTFFINKLFVPLDEWTAQRVQENIFHIYQASALSLAFSSHLRRRQQHSGEFAWWDLCKHAKKKKNSLKEGSEREREKNNCLLQSTNKKEKREKNCCLLIVTEVFMLPLFFLFFSSLCIYRLNKIQMSESTREGPLLHSQSIDVCFSFFFSLFNSHSYILLPSAMCTLRTLHALYIVVERWREGGGCGSSGWKEVRKIYSIETTYTFMRNIMKSRAIFFFYTMFIYENIFYKKTCVWESVYGSFSYYLFFHYQLCVIHDLFFFFKFQ